MGSPTLLIVEDDPTSLNILVEYFKKNHYEVLTATRGDEVEGILANSAIDIVLLDTNLPGKDGLSIMRDIRSMRSLGIIIVTAAADDIDKVIGLELGADDYVTKPYNLRELGARVKNLLYRIRLQSGSASARGEGEASKQINFQGWMLDKQKHCLKSPADEVITLTEGEFQVLWILIDNAGVVTDREHIMKKMRQRSWTYSDRSIDVLVGRVRKKLRDDVEMPTFIRTIHGTGYMFIGELEA
jgi:two-component system torCAD operon response regulator TorR